MNTTEPERTTLSFSAMWSDKLKAAIQERAPREGYPCEFHQGSADFNAIQSAVNQGIDSHLEAVHFSEFRGEHGRRGFRFEADTLHILIRRLMEAATAEDENGDSALSLASGICSTLDIELI